MNVRLQLCRARARAGDRGFTLVELIIAIVLSAMIGGVVVMALVTSLNVASSATAQVGDSTDAGLISSFLVRDAQSAGGIDPVTALADSTLNVALGVSNNASDADGVACTPAAVVKLRLSWMDRSVSPAKKVVVTYSQVIVTNPDGSTKLQLVRGVCTYTGASVAKVDVVLGLSILSASATCFPGPSCTGHPETVQLTVRGKGTRATLVSVMTASLRSAASQLTIIGPESLPNGLLDVPYGNYVMTTIGAAVPTTWSATGMPLGLSIGTSSGIISGTPSLTAAARSYTVTITATDALSAKATKDYTFFVHAPPRAAADVASVNEDATLTVVAPGVLSNDSSPEGNPLAAILYSGVANGALTFNTNGSFVYTPAANFNGTDSFRYKVSDGLVGNLVTVTLTVNAVNDGPVNRVPVTQETPKNTNKLFSSASNLISIVDVDAVTAQVRLTATDGTLTLPARTGLGFTVGDGVGDATMTFTGTVANINLSLVGATFIPTNGFVGAGTLQIFTSDQGSLGSGGTLTDTDSVTINVSSLGIFTAFQDIRGSGQPLGSGTGSSYTSPTYTVTGSGWDVWDDSDGFQFIHRQMTGDGSLTARVVSETVTAGPHIDVSKAGVMFRQGLTDRTMSAMVSVTKGNGSEFVFRAADGTGLPNQNCDANWISSCTAASGAGDALTVPYWVRISRRGNVITGETSSNGTTWTQRGTSQTIAMGSTIYVGLASSAVYQLDTAAVQNNKINTATFDNVKIGSPPFAVADAYSVNEDNTLTMPALNGVLVNDSDGEGDALTAVLVAGTPGLTLNADGSFTYVPVANFVGTASFTYMANDGVLNSAVVTATITVNPANETPSFVKGGDQITGSNLGTQAVPGWATAIDAGTGETGQLVDFIVTNSNNSLFSEQPAIGADGTLTYASAADATGVATVSVSIHDNGGTTNGAADTSAVQTFTILADDAPAVAATGSSLAYTENGTTVLDPGVTVSDADNANLSSATVTMTTAYVNGQDTLAFVDQNGITGTWIPASGALALSGSSSVGNYQAALRSITYNNNSNSPNTTTRTVTFVANDGLLNSNAESRTITLTAVNDAPVVTATVGSMAYNENGTSPLDTGIVVTDPDSANLSSATVRMTTAYLNGQDTLAFVDQNGITGTWTASTGVLALSGSATVADYQTALRSVTYNNNSHAPTTTLRTVTFFANDGILDSNIATRTITVTAVNDAPVNSVPIGQSTPKNTTEVFSSGNGTLISISDLDAAANTVRVQLVTTSGTTSLSGIAGLTFTLGDGTSDVSMTFTGTMTSINSALAGLSFIPTNNFNGTANLQIITNDLGNTGTPGALGDTDNIAIIVDNAPVVTTTGGSAVYVENAAAIVIDSLITVADSDNTNLTSAKVTVATNYVNGQDILAFTNAFSITGSFNAATGILTLSGATTQTNYQLALKTVTYRNTSDNAITTRNVTFVVNDGLLDSNTASKTITVTAVNDLPVVGGTAGSTAYTENGTSVVVPLITTTDADNALSSATVKMTTNYLSTQDSLAFVDQNGITGTWTSATGTLALSGVATPADYQAALRSITYTNSSHAPTTTVRTVSFVINDGTVNSNTATHTITLTAVNDAPVNSIPAGPHSMAKSTVKIFSSANGNLISISDIDAIGTSVVQVQLVSTLGTVTLPVTTGLTINPGDSFTADADMTFTGTIANINLRLNGLKFNAANVAGSANLRIITRDQGATGTGGTQTDTDDIPITLT